MKLLFFLVLLVHSFVLVTPVCAEDTRIIVNRKLRTLAVVDLNGKELFSTKVGIGRGGLKTKKAMSDLVTPTGEFKVDLILSNETSLNKVDKALVKRYETHATFKSLVQEEPATLARTFKNMNSLDFDSDGTADNAYGSAYIGLNSETAVTGPKMRFYKGTPYWYSIALHGTPDESKNIGAANSGGCIHLTQEDLKLLLTNHIQIGTTVVITDSKALRSQ